MVLLVSLVVVFVLWLKIKPYFIRYDTVVGFTGGLGSGKTFESVRLSIRELKKNRFRVRIYNLFQSLKKQPCLPLPMLYSSIPIRISKKEYSRVLTASHLLLQEKIIGGSIVFLDEVDVWANQYAHNNPNIIEIPSKKDLDTDGYVAGGLFDEFVRLFRHYNATPCCEPKLIVNTQATSNIITIIRRRINTVYYQSKFRIIRLPLLRFVPILNQFSNLYTYLVREITISDEIVNTSENMLGDACRRVIGFSSDFKHYDTHCYSVRVEHLSLSVPKAWNDKKTKRLLKCPYKKEKSLIDDDSAPTS